MQLLLSICKNNNDAEIIDSILIYKIINLLIYDESRLSINDLELIERIMIIIYIHALYQTLLHAFNQSLSFSYLNMFESFLNLEAMMIATKFAES